MNCGLINYFQSTVGDDRWSWWGSFPKAGRPLRPDQPGPARISVAVGGCPFDCMHFDISRKAGRVVMVWWVGEIPLLHGFLYLPRDFCHSPKEPTTVQIIALGVCENG
ncbi:hypothetical protein J6590_072366 [Homalodisca vitripennis]|nr:hypothetical protein J6590_072366 [Homalodisca vitripennis]